MLVHKKTTQKKFCLYIDLLTTWTNIQEKYFVSRLLFIFFYFITKTNVSTLIIAILQTRIYLWMHVQNFRARMYSQLFQQYCNWAPTLLAAYKFIKNTIYKLNNNYAIPHNIRRRWRIGHVIPVHMEAAREGYIYMWYYVSWFT